MDIMRELIEKEIGTLILSTIPDYLPTAEQNAGIKAVKLLEEIKVALENDNFDDFMCMDEIIRIMHEAGIRVEDRHDFG